MKLFARLFEGLDQTNKTNEKVELLKNYFSEADDADKVWALALLSGRRPKRQVNTTLLKNWAIESGQIATWLFDECYHVVGDLAETISLLLPRAEQASEESLTEWMAFLKTLEKQDEVQKKTSILTAWDQLQPQERLVFTKLITGSFRIGVSQSLVVKALAELTDTEASVLTHRIMGNWKPDETTFTELLSSDEQPIHLSRPYPFYLAYAIEDDLQTLGKPNEWQAEWKWDGIRSQVIKRGDELFVWSRGEDLVTDKFPEFKALKNILPNGTVIDGEILPFMEGKPLAFSVLQTRIGRKNVTAKILKECPVVVVAYDLLEWQGTDIRQEPLKTRRQLLETLIHTHKSDVITYSDAVTYTSWDELTAIRHQSRENFAEGLMLKKLESPYLTGRRKGDWWKWKIEPFTIDAVLIYAQKGHGRRADLFTDYTFGVWDDTTLVPFAKAYSGLTDKEIKQVDTFVRKNTFEKFGPVRTVKAELVFEIAFEGIQASNRHKSGIAVRFPRILRWRQDKTVADANTLSDLKALLAPVQSL
jgi:DNA ligase-1